MQQIPARRFFDPSWYPPGWTLTLSAAALGLTAGAIHSILMGFVSPQNFRPHLSVVISAVLGVVVAFMVGVFYIGIPLTSPLAPFHVYLGIFLFVLATLFSYAAVIIGNRKPNVPLDL